MTENDQMRLTDARNSFTGKTLTASQFDEAWAVAGIMDREIRRSGMFREKLGHYARAFAGSEKFDQMKGGTIIRDIYRSRYGQSMNQLREGLVARRDALGPDAKQAALEYAKRVCDDVQSGDTMPFYQAFGRQALPLAHTFDITENAAKTLMKDAFQTAHGEDLYARGKALEEEFHLPKREAERAARAADRNQSKARTQTRQP